MYSRKFWIKEYIKRYEFVSEFCHGKILDCRFSKSFSYNSAIMLLKDKNEVISYYNKEEQIVSHKITNDKINFQPVQNDKRNFLENFDCIISFEKNFDRLNFEESVNMFSKFLNENGKLIISAINKEKIQVDNFSSVTLSKEEFLKILGKKFTDIELYSQRLLGEQKSNKLRITGLGRPKKYIVLALGPGSQKSKSRRRRAPAAQRRAKRCSARPVRP